MRTEMIVCKSRNTAKRQCPWAAVIAKVEDGYLCFESRADYVVWRGQR